MFSKRIIFGLTVIIFLISISTLSWAQEKKFTEWGWPLPYEKVSQKSINWMKDKGWWPLSIGTQGTFTSWQTWEGKGFPKKRDLEVKFFRVQSGPEINEATAAGKVQAGLEGNFPFTSLIANKMPVKCLSILSPCGYHATLVPLDSPIKSLKDLKGMSPTPSFGIVAGSSAEFYFQSACEVNGLQIGKDVILKNMRPAEMLIIPKGLTGVVQWDTFAFYMVQKKHAKEIDNIYPYNFYMGNFWIRQEIIDNAPDVAQAVVDTFVEGILWTRYAPEEAMDLVHKDIMFRFFDKDDLIINTVVGNNIFKPTWCYPFKEFWATENARVAAWLKSTNRIKTEVTKADYISHFENRFIDKTFEKLGWRIPDRPPFIPANWPGKVGKPPYPPYIIPRMPNISTTKGVTNLAQPWPEKGDLVRPWYFNGKTYQP